MLSDEEREALQYFNTETKTEAMHYGAVLVKLIEKQSKEIEILNKNMNLLREQNISYKQSIHGLKEMNKIINKKWEDEIKAKIEELEKQDKESKLSHNYLVIPVLQSLLEKE